MLSQNLITKLKHPIVQVFIISLIISGVALSRGWNMFNFPAYQEDEGTYVSQAWSVITQQKLAPYTYWYDHAPAGWLFMSLWHLVVGFFAFDVSINSGRVFILFINIATAVLLYRLVYKASGSLLAAVVAVLVFTVTPLGISMQRRVLLDTIMTFWILVAANLLITRPLSLPYTILSGIAFSVAVLTKEVAIIFLPVFAVFTYRWSHQNIRHFTIPLWAMVTFLTISLYPLLALLKGELFPQGTFLGGDHPHVSLWEAVLFQLHREGGFFFSPDSNFRQALAGWLVQDRLIIIFGFGATVVNLLASIFVIIKKRYLFLSLLSFTYSLYLISGGVILDWYIIPLVTLFSLNIGLLYGLMRELSPVALHNFLPLRLAPLMLLVPLMLQFQNAKYLYAADQTINQRHAITWIRDNMPPNMAILMDNYPYVDLHDPSKEQYPLAHYYWKADQDPEIRGGVLKEDWENVDYVLYNEAVEKTIQQDNLQFLQTVIDNSTEIVRFADGQSPYLRDPYTISIRKVNTYRTELKATWWWYKQTFIQPNGRVIDPSMNNRTTSEGQSYALLRAVWMDDQETFDRVFTWTQENLKKEDRYIYAWRFEGNDPHGFVVDPASATDADQDIALALLFAARRWNDPAYMHSAKRVMKDIWTYETTLLTNGTRIITPGDWVTPDHNILPINPSYFAPYAYRIFGEADTEHDWHSLVNSSFFLIDICSDHGEIFLPTDWCLIDSNSNLIKDQEHAAQYGIRTDIYAHDAMRTLWRLSLDYVWFNEIDRRSLDLLLKMSPLVDQWEREKIIYATYTTQGQPIELIESLTHYGILLPAYGFTKGKVADAIFQEKIISRYTNKNKQFYWGEPTNYFDQNWVWFGTALYTNNLPNLWHK